MLKKKKINIILALHFMQTVSKLREIMVVLHAMELEYIIARLSQLGRQGQKKKVDNLRLYENLPKGYSIFFFFFSITYNFVCVHFYTLKH